MGGEKKNYSTDDKTVHQRYTANPEKKSHATARTVVRHFASQPTKLLLFVLQQ